MDAQKENPVECCPLIDPAQWEDKTFDWHEKRFLRKKVRTFFFMPLNFGSVMRKTDRELRACGATVPDYLGLSDHTSKWNIDFYLAVDKEVPGADNVTLTGKFFTRVYDGPFSETEKWCKDFKAVADSKGMTIKKWFMWYTLCPKCAKKYGNNYVVIFGQIE